MFGFKNYVWLYIVIDKEWLTRWKVAAVINKLWSKNLCNLSGPKWNTLNIIISLFILFVISGMFKFYNLFILCVNLKKSVWVISLQSPPITFQTIL